MKKIAIAVSIAFISIMLFGGLAGAATITGTPPTTGNGTLDADIATAFASLLLSSQNRLDVFKDQEDLTKGFGNANAFSSNAGTFQGFQNYDLFAVGVGVMFGAQAPSLDPTYYIPDNVKDDIREDGDVYAGFAGGAVVNAGIHARFIATGLYFNVKFGQVELGDAENTFQYKNTTFGVGVNYGVIMPHGVFLGFLKWRGVSLGTGITYQKNEVNYEVELQTVTQNVTDGALATGTLVMDPTVNLGVDMETYTVPLEVVTSFQLLWILNISAGVGVDFIYGTSDLNVTAAGDVYLRNLTGATLVSPGTITIDGSTKDVSPSTFRPKIMAGLGFSIMMVKIELPVVYYPEAGAAVGLTASVVF